MTAATPHSTRIAMDVTSLLGPTTGVGQMVKQLTTRLPRYPGMDLTGLLVSWRGRSRLQQVVPPGWKTRALPYPARPTRSLWRSFDWPRVKGYDLVHCPNYVVPPTDGAVRLVTVHDLTAWRHPEMVSVHSRHYPRFLEKAVADGAQVHAVSAHVAGELEHELGIDADRIHLVPNGIEPLPAGDAGRGRSLIDAPYVLTVGTIEPRKDLPTLVEAMAAIWPILPDVKLIIAGPDGWGRDDLDRVVERFGVEDRVRCLGYVSDPVMADLLAGAELLAFPSVYEGFGLPILEAMHAGLPVVSTTAGAIPEVAGRAAILVEPRDPSALAGALLSVLEDDELRVQLADAGRRRVAGYSWDRSAEELVGLYHRLLGRTPPTGIAAASDRAPERPVPERV